MLALLRDSVRHLGWTRRRLEAPVVLHALGESDIPALWTLLAGSTRGDVRRLAARFVTPTEPNTAEQRLAGVIARLQSNGARVRRVYLCVAALSSAAGYPALPCGLLRLDDTLSVRQQRQAYAPHQRFERAPGTGWLWLAVLLADPVNRPALEHAGPTTPRIAVASPTAPFPANAAQSARREAHETPALDTLLPPGTRHDAAETSAITIPMPARAPAAQTADAIMRATTAPAPHGAAREHGAEPASLPPTAVLATLLQQSSDAPLRATAPAVAPDDHAHVLVAPTAPAVPSVRVADLANADNLLLVGPKGAGKTTLLLQIYQQRTGYHEALDPHNEAGKWPRCSVYGGGRRYEVIRERLLKAVTTMSTRYQALDAGTTTQSTLRQSRITLMGDEWGGIRRNLSDVRPSREQPGLPGAGTMLKALLTEGRKAAVCVIAVTHDDTSEQVGLDGAMGLLNCFDFLIYLGGQATGNESIPRAVRRAAAALPRPAVAINTERKQWYILHIPEEASAPTTPTLIPPAEEPPHTPAPVALGVWAEAPPALADAPMALHHGKRAPQGLDAVREAAARMQMPLPIRCSTDEREGWLDDTKVRLLLAVAAKHHIAAQPLTPLLFGVSTGVLAQAIRERLSVIARQLNHTNQIYS